MIKECFFHVGWPKAASTYLQQSVFPYVDGLDFNPPEIWNPLVDFMHKSYVKNAFDEVAFESLKNAFDRYSENRSGEKLLISNEGLCPIHYGSIELLDIYTEMIFRLRDDAKIILVVRNQVDWINSMYHTLTIHHGYMRSLEEYISSTSQSQEWKVNAKMLSYSFLYEHYQKKLGDKNRLYVVNFDKIKKSPQYFADEILSCMGITSIKKWDVKRVNTSRSKSQLAALSHILKKTRVEDYWKNKYTYLPDYQLGGVQKVFVYYPWKIIRYFLLFIASSVQKKYEGVELMPRAERERIERFYHNDNIKFWNSMKI